MGCGPTVAEALFQPGCVDGWKGNHAVLGRVNRDLFSVVSGETMKRMERDGKFYRMRRGKLVEIPAEWVGQVVYPRTVRERASKRIDKVARESKYADNRNYKDRAMEIDSELAVEELKRK